MSLTNPVLNDIVIKEINHIQAKLNNLESEIHGKMNSISGDLSGVNAKSLKQDYKIDVIHKLFNSVKKNKDEIDYSKDAFDTKKLYSEIEHSINDKYAVFVEKVMNMITQYNNQQECNMNILNQNYNNITSSLESTKEIVTGLKNRVNELENRVILLEKRSNVEFTPYSRKNDYQDDVKQDDYTNTQKDDNTWVKVVKNRSRNKPFYRY